MRGGLVTRDFDRVMPWLYKQYELADSYGGEKNRLTPGLLENIKKAYDKIKFISKNIKEIKQDIDLHNIDINNTSRVYFDFIKNTLD